MILIASVPHTGTRTLLFFLQQLLPGPFHMFGADRTNIECRLLWGHFYPENEEVIPRLAAERTTFIPLRDPVLSFLTTWSDAMPRQPFMRRAQAHEQAPRALPPDAMERIQNAMERHWRCWVLFMQLWPELQSRALQLIPVDINQVQPMYAARSTPAKAAYLADGTLPPVFEALELGPRLVTLQNWLRERGLLFD